MTDNDEAVMRGILRRRTAPARGWRGALALVGAVCIMAAFVVVAWRPLEGAVLAVAGVALLVPLAEPGRSHADNDDSHDDTVTR